MPTGISTVNKNADDIRVFPSLFKDKLTLEYQSIKSTGRLEITDITGQTKLNIPVKHSLSNYTRLVLDESQFCISMPVACIFTTDGWR